MTQRRPLPTGTVTFLFTDIEGSTRLLQRLGEGYGRVLDEHHRVLRDAFGSSGGVEMGTEGDAFFVVYASARDAVEGASAAQRALSEHPWPDGVSVAVRMGIHTGAAEFGGDNYRGLDVHRAARITSAAHGGQVLLSAATAALVEPDLPPGTSIKELGTFRLKDLERPEHLFQLCIDGLRADFPPARGLDANLTNLPVSLTAFVGRDFEREEVAALLVDNRLVTLTGPGGTGKTRLSIAVGEHAIGSFRDGVFIVLLAPLQDSMLVASTIAHALGLLEQGSQSIEESLMSYLSDKELLLILDNFEQVVEAAPLVPQLLQAAPKLRVLVSSRTPLRVSGEQQYAVPPLGVPDPDAFPSLTALAEFEAIALFLERARSASPAFELTDDNAQAVVDICRRVDGLPLAIELAAARARLISPQEIVKRLDASLSFLTSRARDLPERQRTLRDAIGWSYDLLEPSDQAFFRRLGVFVATFGFEAAERVTQADVDDVDVFDALETLLDNSLIRRWPTTSGESRFRMLQTIREFALDRLAAAGEEESTRRRHGEWYRRLIEELAPRFTAGPDPLDAVGTEHDNVRAALRWAIDAKDVETAMSLGATMWRFWQLRGHLAEGRRWLTEIVALQAHPDHAEAHARAIMALGSIAYWQNDYDATGRYYREALEIQRTVGDAQGLQEALYNVGFLSLLQRDPQSALGVFEESRTIAGQRSDKKGLADTAWGLAMAAIQARDWDAARRWGAECERLYEELGDLFGRGLAQFTFFQVARYTGDLPEARRLMSGYMQDAAVHDRVGYSTGLEMLAEIELLEGNLERAVKMRAASEGLREDYGGGSPLPLIELTDVRQAVADRAGEAQTMQWWQEGRSMSQEESLAYMLKDPEQEMGRP